MQNINIHKQKLIALVLAAVALITMILPWQTYRVYTDFMGGTAGRSITGFNGWGWISLLGVIAVAVACFLGDKTKIFDSNSKIIALSGFGGIALGAIIFMIRVMSAQGTSIGFGLIITIIVGLAGLAFVSGILDQFMQPKATSSGLGSTPPPPPKS